MSAMASSIDPRLEVGGIRFSLLGTTAALFEPSGSFDIATQRRIWGLAARAGDWPEVAEAVPGVTNLMLVFSRPPDDTLALAARVAAAWQVDDGPVACGRHLDLPIVYGGKGGPHLGDVALYTGMTIDDVVAIHTAPLYTVFAVGSHPGYCYLGGMDPRLFVPRREVPLLSIPKGSLSVAGMQTGVSASAGPSGWHTIGIADVDFFDAARARPSLLRPGDTIRFHAQKVLR
jgi:5-oxoprolinase (ATP-hydrolysing) subunit B